MHRDLLHTMDIPKVGKKMKMRKIGSSLTAYRISLMVIGGVGVGFWLAYLDGAGLKPILTSALTVASVMTLLFSCILLSQSSRQKRTKDKTNR